MAVQGVGEDQVGQVDLLEDHQAVTLEVVTGEDLEVHQVEAVQEVAGEDLEVRQEEAVTAIGEAQGVVTGEVPGDLEVLKEVRPEEVASGDPKVEDREVGMGPKVQGDSEGPKEAALEVGEDQASAREMVPHLLHGRMKLDERRSLISEN